MYFWYPEWTAEFTFEPILIGIGTTTLDILNFTWAEVTGSDTNLCMYGAMLEKDLTGDAPLSLSRSAESRRAKQDVWERVSSPVKRYNHNSDCEDG